MKYLILAAFAAAFTSCTGIMSGITGQPILTEPVVTKDGSTFNVASADVLRTKGYPKETAWGLYDAGLVARQTAEVTNTGK